MGHQKIGLFKEKNIGMGVNVYWRTKPAIRGRGNRVWTAVPNVAAWHGRPPKVPACNSLAAIIIRAYVKPV
jgi:hypothetical protein